MPRKPSRRGWGEGRVDRGKFAKGEYRVQVSLGIKADGKRDRRYVYGATKDEALDRAHELRRDKAAGAPPRDNETLDVFLTRWLARRGRRVSPSTLRTYSILVNKHLIPRVGKRPLRSLTVGEVEDLMDAIVESGRSPKVANDARKILVAAYKEAIKNRQADFNPAESAESLEYRPKRFGTLDGSHLARLLPAAGDFAPLVVCAIGLGLRQSELLALTWDDVEEDRVHVRRTLQRIDGGYAMGATKTANSARTVPLTRPVREALQVLRDRLKFSEGERPKIEWPDGGTYDLVFRTSAGMPMNRHGVTDRWYQLVNRVNEAAKAEDANAPQIPRVRWHDLRHSFATLLLEAGEEMGVISKLLGHSSIGTTADIYAHVTEAKKQAAVNRLDDLLGTDKALG